MHETCAPTEQYPPSVVAGVALIVVGLCVGLAAFLILLSPAKKIENVGHRPDGPRVFTGSMELDPLGTVTFSRTATTSGVRLTDTGEFSGEAAVEGDEYTALSFDVSCDAPHCPARVTDRGHVIGWARAVRADGSGDWISFGSANDHRWSTEGIQESGTPYGTVLTETHTLYGRAYLYGKKEWVRFPCTYDHLPCQDPAVRAVSPPSSS